MLPRTVLQHIANNTSQYTVHAVFRPIWNLPRFTFQASSTQTACSHRIYQDVLGVAPAASTFSTSPRAYMPSKRLEKKLASLVKLLGGTEAVHAALKKAPQLLISHPKTLASSWKFLWELLGASGKQMLELVSYDARSVI